MENTLENILPWQIILLSYFYSKPLLIIIIFSYLIYIRLSPNTLYNTKSRTHIILCILHTISNSTICIKSTKKFTFIKKRQPFLKLHTQQHCTLLYYRTHILFVASFVVTLLYRSLVTQSIVPKHYTSISEPEKNLVILISS